jgi:hypothetical protein
VQHFYCKIISFLPEIVGDDSEAEVAEKLLSLYQSDNSLMVPCLDALTQLTLPRDVQEVREISVSIFLLVFSASCLNLGGSNVPVM